MPRVPDSVVMINREIVEDALAECGGKLLWTKLRDRLLAQKGALSAEAIVASIPEEYCSCSDAFVRLPDVLSMIDKSLEHAGGALSWWQLRDAVLESGFGRKPGAGREALGQYILACLPETYLNETDVLVRFHRKRAARTDDDGHTKRQRYSYWNEWDALELVGEGSSAHCGWKYPLRDDEFRCYAGHLANALSPSREKEAFEIVDTSVAWQRTGPRWTAWMVANPCTCAYGYGGMRIQPKTFPEWMWNIMSDVMPLCGLTDKATWPNSCNLNRYDDEYGSVGWHADDEPLFQGKYQDCLIISLSLGQAREFSLGRWRGGGGETSFWLKGGDLCTMEGMTQKYYKHAALKDQTPGLAPRINLTWRWIVAHEKNCPLAS